MSKWNEDVIRSYKHSSLRTETLVDIYSAMHIENFRGSICECLYIYLVFHLFKTFVVCVVKKYALMRWKTLMKSTVF